MLDSCVTNRFQYDKNLLLWLTYTGEDSQVWYIVSDLTAMNISYGKIIRKQDIQVIIQRTCMSILKIRGRLYDMNRVKDINLKERAKNSPNL